MTATATRAALGRSLAAAAASAAAGAGAALCLCSPSASAGALLVLALCSLSVSASAGAGVPQLLPSLSRLCSHSLSLVLYAPSTFVEFEFSLPTVPSASAALAQSSANFVVVG